jgi:uncharacterized protein YbjQ (UPF0145 family)
MILTSTDSLGNTPCANIGLLVEVESVGLHVGRELLIRFRDVFGGRSQTLDQQTYGAIDRIFARLVKRATALGADALVGIRIQVQPIAFSGSRMLQVIVFGTAVRAQPEPRHA